MERVRIFSALAIGLVIISGALYFKGEPGSKPASVVAVEGDFA